MATAKRELSDTRVQGPPHDQLDELIAIASAVAERAGFLQQEVIELETGGETGRQADDDERESA